MKNEVIRLCVDCGKEFTAFIANQSRCGSFKDKVGCSWERRNFRVQREIRKRVDDIKMKNDFKMIYGREGNKIELDQFKSYWRVDKLEKILWKGV